MQVCNDLTTDDDTVVTQFFSCVSFCLHSFDFNRLYWSNTAILSICIFSKDNSTFSPQTQVERNLSIVLSTECKTFK